MTSTTQAKVLRILQDQRFERVGGTETIQTDARIIAATNQDLEALAIEGRFRRDLYYRLKVYTIYLPPIRERLDDLPLLVNHFIQSYNSEVGRSVRSVSPETIQLLKAYPWPGNVRELQGVIKNALVNATHDVLTPDCLPSNVHQGGSSQTHSSQPDELDLNVTRLTKQLLDDGETGIYHRLQQTLDQAVLEEVLRYTNGNQVEAARRLGISRTTLRAKLQALSAVEVCRNDSKIAQTDQ